MKPSNIYRPTDDTKQTKHVFFNCPFNLFSTYANVFHKLLQQVWLKLSLFLFKCAIFAYNCRNLCFMRRIYQHVIMLHYQFTLNIKKFKVCVMLMFDSFLRLKIPCFKALFNFFPASYFLKWSKYICQRFTTYGFEFDLNIWLFLFKCAIFPYKYTNACFLRCSSVITL
jgi:hypothetical protein